MYVRVRVRPSKAHQFNMNSRTLVQLYLLYMWFLYMSKSQSSLVLRYLYPSQEKCSVCKAPAKLADDAATGMKPQRFNTAWNSQPAVDRRLQC